MYYKELDPDIQQFIQKAKRLGFDIFVATRINESELAISFSEDHGLISVTPGKEPGSWTVK